MARPSTSLSLLPSTQFLLKLLCQPRDSLLSLLRLLNPLSSNYCLPVDYIASIKDLRTLDSLG